MSKKDEALKLALEFLEQGNFVYPTSLATTIKEALAEQPDNKECESELASQPLYEGITQNTQNHYSKFHSWFDSELHRQKYTKDHPAYLAAQEAWNAANDAAQHRINRLNADIEAWKVRFKIAEDALVKLNGPEQKAAQQQEPVAWGVDWGKAGDRPCVSIIKRLPGGGIEVLATEYGPPASKPWVGLTDDEIDECYYWKDRQWTTDELVRHVETKLREKNA